MIQDPICGMEVNDKKYYFEYDGDKHFFCSEGCLEKFKECPDNASKLKVYDLVIIGAGPAGLTAAIYASVLKMDTFVITNDIGGQAIDSTLIKNYMGFDFIVGTELIEKFQTQFLHHHYLDHKIDEVVGIKKVNDHFSIFTKEGDRIIARSLIISSGMKRRKLGIPGEERLQRKGVSYSKVQDLPLFSGMEVVVIGGGNSGVQAAIDLRKLGANVTIITKGKLMADQSDIRDLKSAENITILEGYDVLEIVGDEKVESIFIQPQNAHEKIKITCQAVFIQIGFLPNNEFCADLVQLNDKGEIMIQADCSTNVNGIFACGDITNAYGKRIIIATGEGAKAALRVRQYLLQAKN